VPERRVYFSSSCSPERWLQRTTESGVPLSLSPKPPLLWPEKDLLGTRGKKEKKMLVTST